jgi:hypothetical protein
VDGRFQEVLSEAGFNGGVRISEAFFRAHISGRHNPEIAGTCGCGVWGGVWLGVAVVCGGCGWVWL